MTARYSSPSTSIWTSQTASDLIHLRVISVETRVSNTRGKIIRCCRDNVKRYIVHIRDWQFFNKHSLVASTTSGMPRALLKLIIARGLDETIPTANIRREPHALLHRWFAMSCPRYFASTTNGCTFDKAPVLGIHVLERRLGRLFNQEGDRNSFFLRGRNFGRTNGTCNFNGDLIRSAQQ